MGKLFDVALEWLNEEEWSFTEHKSEDGQNAWARAGYSADNAKFDIVFDAYEDIEQFFVYIYFTVSVPEAKRLAVAELLTRLNWGMRIGNFELDMDEGHIRCKAFIDVEGAALVSTMITNLLRPALSSSDKNFPRIMQLCYSDKTVSQVLELDEKPAELKEVKTLQ